MFVKLDEEVTQLLCCPLCKGPLNREEKGFICTDCPSSYPVINCRSDGYEEEIHDFRINYPGFCQTATMRKWLGAQKAYEDLHRRFSAKDNLKGYLDEIDSVKDIYTRDEFAIAGSVLDVGGHQGRLRHFLRKEDISLYVSIDPYPEVFRNMRSQTNLLHAYPCLNTACNFLAAHGENLPFKNNSFDWVHMRSVIDHFRDPCLALKEAHRVLRRPGFLMIGASVHDETKNPLLSRVIDKLRHEDAVGICRTVCRRARNLFCYQRGSAQDAHTFHFTFTELITLLKSTGFRIVKERWQKPSFSHCIYVLAEKI